MENQQRNVLIGLVVVVIIGALIWWGTQNRNQEANGEEIKIGVISPITGPASAYGDPAVKATLLAVEEINQAGGVNGKEFKAVVEDGMCDAKATASATNKLIEVDNVKIILGGHCSTESLTIAPIASERKVIQLATFTSSDKYSDAGDFSFRNFPTSDFYDGKLGEVAYQRYGVRNVAAVYEQKDFPTGTFNAFTQHFKAAGGNVVSEQSFIPAERDFHSSLLKIQPTNADSIYFASQGPEVAVLFYKHLRELGMDGKYRIFTNVQGITPGIYKETQDIVEGKVFSMNPYADPQEKRMKEFLERYEERHGSLPPIDLFGIASSYDSVLMIRDALQQCKSEDVECLKQFLYSLENWEGAGGAYTMDRNGDVQTPIALHYFTADGKEVFEPL